MSSKNKIEVSTIRRAVADLRDLILAKSRGEFLGSEEELTRQIEVSRPTFRQAAKLLEQEQLLVIKRGVGGGYFVRLPTTAGVSHAAAVYLYTRHATVEHVVRSARPILAEISRIVALDQSPSGRKRLRKFLAHDASRPPDDVQGFLVAERDFVRLLASSSPNPVLELFALALVEFGTTFNVLRADAVRPELISQRRVLRNNLVQAILQRDAEIAVLMSHRRTDAIIAWMHADAKSRGNRGLTRRVRVGGREDQ